MTDSDHEDPGERLRRLLKSEDETLSDLPADLTPRKTPSPTPPPPPTPEPPAETGSGTPPPAATPPASVSGSTPPLSQPALDRDNMPLPRRVNQIDLDGTRVSRAAYDRPTGRRQAPTRVTRPPQVPPQPPRQQPPPPRASFDLSRYLNSIDWSSGMGCLLRLMIAAVFLLVIVGLCL